MQRYIICYAAPKHHLGAEEGLAGLDIAGVVQHKRQESFHAGSCLSISPAQTRGRGEIAWVYVNEAGLICSLFLYEYQVTREKLPPVHVGGVYVNSSACCCKRPVRSKRLEGGGWKSLLMHKAGKWGQGTRGTFRKLHRSTRVGGWGGGVNTVGDVQPPRSTCRPPAANLPPPPCAQVVAPPRQVAPSPSRKRRRGGGSRGRGQKGGGVLGPPGLRPSAGASAVGVRGGFVCWDAGTSPSKSARGVPGHALG